LFIRYIFLPVKYDQDRFLVLAYVSILWLL